MFEKNLSALLKVNESRYIALFMFSGSVKKLFSTDCINVFFFINIVCNRLCAVEKSGVAPLCLYRDSLILNV